MLRPAPWIAVLLAAGALAGCIDADDPPEPDEGETGPAYDPPSPRRYDIVVQEEERVAMSDGVEVHNVVYRPETSDPVGVFINFSPYWGDTAQTRGDAFSQYMIEHYVPRGFAVVLSAIRGTGHSGGCFEIASDREVQDLHEVVDHFANVEWSNGNVLAGGKSYDSTTQNGMIAKAPHPALKGIFHVSGISDMYAYNYKGGVPYATGPAFNTYYWFQGTDEYGVSLVGAGSTENEDPESLARLVEDAACTELPETQAHGVGSGATGQKTDYWIERDWTRTIGDSEWNGSIFFVHGLQDWNVKPDHILPWIDNLPDQVRVKGWLHQAGHVYPERADWNRTMLAWMDAELNGKDTGIWDTPAWEVQSDDGDWYHHPVWPTAYEDGRGVEATSRNGGTVSSGASLDAGPDGMHMSGSIRVNATVSSDVPDAALLVTVYDEGGGERAWVTEGVLRLVYHDSLDAPAPYTPGAEVDLALLTYPADHIFPPGHQMVIEFGGEPRHPVATAEQTDVAVHGFDASIPIASAEPMAQQPVFVECFTC